MHLSSRIFPAAQQLMPIAFLWLVVASVVHSKLTCDAVVHWDNVLSGVIRADRQFGGPGWASRNSAIVHLAMYDAVNAITGEYQLYALSPSAVPAGASGASINVAVGIAAHRSLIALYPSLTPLIDDRLAMFLTSCDYSDTQRNVGVSVGEAAANAIIALRSNDNSGLTFNGTMPSGAGYWTSDPLSATQQSPLGVQWGRVTPFLVSDVSVYNAPPPPSVTSPEYTEAFNYLKSIGARNSTTRTVDQLEIGLFWAYDRAGMGPPTIFFNQILQHIAAARNNNIRENARLFALANAIMADAGIACWYTKYTYNYWRPISAIRSGDADDNPDTIGDPNWEPYGCPNGVTLPGFTPPFPAYTSGHSTFGASFFTCLKLFYGREDIKFSVASQELEPGLERQYNNFETAIQENAFSRVYLGVHWPFDCSEGVIQGRRIAIDAFNTKLQPVEKIHSSAMMTIPTALAMIVSILALMVIH